MKTLKFIPLALLIMALVSFTGTSISYSSSNDDSHLSANDSIYSPPGYMNKDIQQARTLTDKYLANKDKTDQKTEATQRDVSQKVEMQAQEKPKAELKKKQSSSGIKKTATAATGAIKQPDDNIKIGSGKQYDANGQLVTPGSGSRAIYEVINGKKYIYCGFDNVGTSNLTEAFDYANRGDRIILRGGTYDGSWEAMGQYGWDTLNIIPEGISVYGGYGEDGTRDLINNHTTLEGASDVTMYSDSEMNGITFTANPFYTDDLGTNYYMPLSISAMGSNISIRNVTDSEIRGGEWLGWVGKGDGITLSVRDGSVLLENNNFGNAVYVTGVGTHDETDFGCLPVVMLPGEENYGAPLSGPLTRTGVGTPVSVTSINNNFKGEFSVGGIGDMAFRSSGDYFGDGYAFNSGMNPDLILPMGLSYSNGTYTPLFTFNNASKNPNTITENGINASIANQLLLQSAASDFYLTQPYRPYESNSYIGLKNISPGLLSALFTNSLADKNILNSHGVEPGQAINPLATNVGENILRTYALAAPLEANDKFQDGIMKLVSIIKSPTKDQGFVLDVIKALLVDASKTEKDAGAMNAQDLKKAQDDLLQAVANILLAQGVPDLLKSGDVANVRAIFSELDHTRAKVMLDYSTATKPYYENMIKDMAKNMAILQSRNLLNPNITKEELSKLPPSELDKILEKIKNMKDRSFEEEYLLQQEQKYRKDYIDPSKKKLEGDMKGMLKSFTERLNEVLKTTDKK